MKGLILAVFVALASFCFSHAVHAAYTDLAKYRDDLRQAKNDTKRRLEIRLMYLRDVTAKALENNDEMLWVGLKEKLNEAIHEFIAYKKEPDSKREDQIKIGTELEALRKEILAGPEKVHKAIINKPAPQDIYKGSDKGAIKDKINAKWKERYPEDQIVSIRFDKENWERKKSKNWVTNGSYYQNVDVSTLTVRVIVKKDAETATIHGIYVQRDNDNPGKEVEIGRKGTFAPQDILLSNVK